MPSSAAVFAVRSHQHPDLLARKSNLTRVILLPPRVEVEELSFDDDVTRLRDVEDGIESQLADLITARLLERQFSIQPAHLDSGDLDASNDLRFQLSELYQSYGQLSWKVYRKGALPREQALQCKATMGSAVNLFADRAQADGVLFTTMDAVTKSAGLRGKDVFYTVLFALGGTYVEAPVAAAILELALVDGTSGELLWSHRVGATFRKSIDPAFLVNLAFAEFPQFPSGVRTAAIASSPDSEPVVGPKNERGAPASVPGSGAERRWRAQAQARYSLAQ